MPLTSAPPSGTRSGSPAQTSVLGSPGTVFRSCALPGTPKTPSKVSSTWTSRASSTVFRGGTTLFRQDRPRKQCSRRASKGRLEDTGVAVPPVEGGDAAGDPRRPSAVVLLEGLRRAATSHGRGPSGSAGRPRTLPASAPKGAGVRRERSCCLRGAEGVVAVEDEFVCHTARRLRTGTCTPGFVFASGHQHAP